MTPIEQLAAARLNVVGPYLPAKEEWLKGWTGPVEYLDHEAAENGDADESTWRPAITNALGMVWYEDDACEWRSADRDRPTLRLDTRRAEVRHLLCDLGIAPEWARNSAVACWCAGMGVEPVVIFPEWVAVDHFAKPWERAMGLPGVIVGVYRFGWVVTVSGKVVASGPDPNPEGRAHADLAALRARCILTEPDGYYVPLADGGIGWWGHG